MGHVVSLTSQTVVNRLTARPKQSTGLFGRNGTSVFNMWLVGENSCFPPHPFSAFLRLAVLTHGVTARQRAEYPHFVRRFRLTATRALPLTCKGD